MLSATNVGPALKHLGRKECRAPFGGSGYLPRLFESELIDGKRRELCQCISIFHNAVLDLRNARSRACKLHKRVFGFGSRPRARFKLPAGSLSCFRIVDEHGAHDAQRRLSRPQIHVGLSRFGGDKLAHVGQRQRKRSGILFGRAAIPILCSAETESPRARHARIVIR